MGNGEGLGGRAIHERTSKTSRKMELKDKFISVRIVSSLCISLSGLATSARHGFQNVLPPK